VKRTAFAATTLLALLFASAPAAQDRHEYRAGDVRVVVVPIRGAQQRAASESRIEFHGGKKLFCVLDCSSEDGEHGFGIVKASWTSDEQFFVFSLTSSGGHQSWHAPTLFYSRKAGTIYYLDDYVGGGAYPGGISISPHQTQ